MQRQVTTLLAIGVAGALCPKSVADTFDSASISLDGDHSEAVEPHCIPLSELGFAVGQQYSGEALSITPTLNGAKLTAAFQKLEGYVTEQGLHIVSTASSTLSSPEQFRATAYKVGRDDTLPRYLPQLGKVLVQGDYVAFVRPGLAEEYRVSVDGIRQDFVLTRPPEGQGRLLVELAVEGAEVDSRAYGARLVLNGSGRAIAYNRLEVRDAAGRNLTAKIRVLAKDRMAIVVEDDEAVYPIRIDPTYSDADWISTGGFPGADNDVYAIATDGGGNLYVGGAFKFIGDMLVNGIAKWDGNQWSALGGGVNGSVDALELSGTNIYVGGSFSTAGGIQASNVALWNGIQWSPLGDGVDEGVYALLLDGSNLYVGGGFSTAGGNPAGCFAVWDGSAWSAMGDAFTHPSDPAYISAIEMFEGQLYVGGQFHKSGAVDTVSIARWSGSAWEAVGDGLGTVNASASVQALTVFQDELVAAGYFSTASGVSVANIAQWNGSAWSALGSGLNNYTFSLAASADTLYAGGYFTAAGGNSASHVAAWNGSIWSSMGAGTDDSVSALLVAGNTLYAGGGFVEAGGVTAYYIAKWESGAWSGVGQEFGFDGAIRALAVSGTDIYVGGFFTSTPGGPANRIARWDGNNWSPLGLGVDGPVSALAVIGETLYAAGGFAHAGGNPADSVAQWNNSNWSSVGSGFGDGYAFVRALAVMDDQLYAGGTFTNAGGVSANSIARWSGSEWFPLGSGLFYEDGPYSQPGSVDALAVSGTDLYVGGEFTEAGGVPASNIARWDGSVWHALGDGVTHTQYSAQVAALAAQDNEVYVGGYFDLAGGNPVNALAKWDGSSWSALGTGFDEESGVEALFLHQGQLFVGGYFTNAGGVSASCLACWDGVAWSAVGSPLSRLDGYPYPGIQALAAVGDDLYVAGNFDFAGDVASPYLAIARPGGGSAYSGPFVVYGSGQVTIYLLVPEQGEYQIQRTINQDLQNWENIGTTSGGADGYITYVDTSPPSLGAYYRAVLIAP